MISNRYSTFLSAGFSIVAAVLTLVVIQARETTGIGLPALLDSLRDLVAWMGGKPIDFIGPIHVLHTLGITMGITIASLTVAITLALGCVLITEKWPQHPLLRLPGILLSMLSFLPAVVIGFLFCIFYARYLNPGYSPIGPDSPIPMAWRVVISVTFLATGNGVFQDLYDGIGHDVERIKRESFVFAAVSRGERITPYYIRSLTVPLTVRLLALVPVFIGASIPFEFIFSIRGAGQLAFRFVDQFLRTGDGTIYPVILLVLSLGCIVALSIALSDLLRRRLDPRQREEVIVGNV